MQLQTIVGNILVFALVTVTSYGCGWGALGIQSDGPAGDAFATEGTVAHIADDVRAFFDAEGRWPGEGGDVSASRWAMELADWCEDSEFGDAVWYRGLATSDDACWPLGKPRLTIERSDAGEVTSVEVRTLGWNRTRDDGMDDLMVDVVTGERIETGDWDTLPKLHPLLALVLVVLLTVSGGVAMSSMDGLGNPGGLLVCGLLIAGLFGSVNIAAWQVSLPIDPQAYALNVIFAVGPIALLGVLAWRRGRAERRHASFVNDPDAEHDSGAV